MNGFNEESSLFPPEMLIDDKPKSLLDRALEEAAQLQEEFSREQDEVRRQKKEESLEIRKELSRYLGRY